MVEAKGISTNKHHRAPFTPTGAHTANISQLKRTILYVRKQPTPTQAPALALIKTSRHECKRLA